MPQTISTAADAAVTVPQTPGADHAVPPDPENLSFVDVEHGDPDGADVEAAAASWDGFI